MADPVVCQGTCSVSVTIAPPEPSEEDISDLAQVGSLLLVAIVVVFCAKQLLNLFSVNSNED